MSELTGEVVLQAVLAMSFDDAGDVVARMEAAKLLSINLKGGDRRSLDVKAGETVKIHFNDNFPPEFEVKVDVNDFDLEDEEPEEEGDGMMPDDEEGSGLSADEEEKEDEPEGESSATFLVGVICPCTYDPATRTFSVIGAPAVLDDARLTLTDDFVSMTLVYRQPDAEGYIHFDIKLSTLPIGLEFEFVGEITPCEPASDQLNEPPTFISNQIGRSGGAARGESVN